MQGSKDEIQGGLISKRLSIKQFIQLYEKHAYFNPELSYYQNYMQKFNS